MFDGSDRGVGAYWDGLVDWTGPANGRPAGGAGMTQTGVGAPGPADGTAGVSVPTTSDDVGRGSGEVRDPRGPSVGALPVGRTSSAEIAALRRRRLARLDALVEVARGVSTALASAGSREGIKRHLCDRLAGSELYATAWAADAPTWAGDADRWTGAGPGAEAAAPPAAVREAAVGTGEADGTTVVADDRGRRWTLVPLSTGGTVHGAVGLRPGADRPDGRPSVTDREREVLAALGGIVARTMTAVERRQLLAAHAVVELAFRSGDEDGALLGAASRVGCRLAVTGVVPDAGDGHLAYVRVENGAPDDVADALAGVAGGDARPIHGSDGEGLLEWTVPGSTILGTLARSGGTVCRAAAGDGTATFVVEVPSNADARALVDRVRGAFPDVRLDAKRERERPAERADAVPGSAVERLTERQADVLEAAYRAGYFEWPRASTAEEVADDLGISAPTLHGHLRKAERSLLAALFDEECSRDDR